MVGKTFVAFVLSLAGAVVLRPPAAGPALPQAPVSHAGPIFQTAASCMACHNGMTGPSGEDISIGASWRASMMAHSARDPYWQAAVRREVTDHPLAGAAIENECSRCHMPMAHVLAQAGGRDLPIFATLAPAGAAPDPLALDGVSCAVCHQIGAANLGRPSSFTGGFTIDTTPSAAARRMLGPYVVDAGRASIMRSATGFEPAVGLHIQQSELCATCHTLYTHPLDRAGRSTGTFPEQVPYQEWLHSEYRASRSCQDCHMPVVDEPAPIASVLGEPRAGFSRHDFRGGNFFMLGMLDRYRDELGVDAPAADFAASISRTKAFLQSASSTVSVDDVRVAGGRVEATVRVRNLAGHKLPTAYPSRRAWLFVTLREASGRVVFSSGEPQPTGAIAGNDNDEDGARFEPHYTEIRSPGQVQIYETIMGNTDGAVTTGLLSAVVYLKDNRVLPRGFDKRTAHADVAVRGAALADPDFGGGEDAIRYSIDARGATGPLTLRAELWYQPIAYRWARNLHGYTTAEPQRFVRYYEEMASSSAVRLAEATRSTR